MADGTISKEQTLAIAHLARLRLSDDEIGALQNDLNGILGYVDSLRSLDLSDVEPTAHGSVVPTPLRKDALHESLPIERALAAAPESGQSAFVVPKVVG
jgi:aspartyl-tRNA(Asn)/glutamyl-tRNA(Gln) amidotransferase subunit C